jgi:hypothetical protein
MLLREGLCEEITFMSRLNWHMEEAATWIMGRQKSWWE